MASPTGPAPRPRAGAAERILRATGRTIVDRGAVALTMHDVAEEAGVSKGLIHYHFHDKETLLARLAEWMTRNRAARDGGVDPRAPRGGGVVGGAALRAPGLKAPRAGGPRRRRGGGVRGRPR